MASSCKPFSVATVIQQYWTDFPWNIPEGSLSRSLYTCISFNQKLKPEVRLYDSTFENTRPKFSRLFNLLLRLDHTEMSTSSKYKTQLFRLPFLEMKCLTNCMVFVFLHRDMLCSRIMTPSPSSILVT